MAILVGGSLVLDYIGTLSERTTEPVEQLAEPRDLGRWLVDAGLLDRAPTVGDRDLRDAVRLREALFSMIAREIDGKPRRLAAGQRLIINRAATAAPPVVRFSTTGKIRREGDVRAGLSAVTRDAVSLLDREDGSVLKWCADETCTHAFVDRSRGHRRRWCDMAGCGDRAKAAAYRSRQRAAQA